MVVMVTVGSDIQPSAVNSCAFSKGPPAELGTLSVDTGARRSWFVGASCNATAGAEQAALA
eukprot:scaffold168259_cov19-Tisochrysis_lutea.AAC.1